MLPIFDPLYMIFWLPGLILAGMAQWKVKTTFARYSRVANRRGITGAQAARRILDAAGLTNVRIETAQGFLGDHYDPRSKVLRLSGDVYSRASLASVGVAAHEVGHALQDKHGYAPMRWRSALVPAASLGSNFAWIALILGLVIQSTGLMIAGVVLFSAVVLFQVVTLPVEFNASSRALAALEGVGVLDQDEIGGARSVLSAAAMTYLAGAIAAALQLVYFLLRSGLIGGRDE